MTASSSPSSLTEITQISEMSTCCIDWRLLPDPASLGFGVRLSFRPLLPPIQLVLLLRKLPIVFIFFRVDFPLSFGLLLFLFTCA